jgi:hypothetical protein
MVHPGSGTAERCARNLLVAGSAALFMACGEPTGTSGSSTFTADVRGSTNERLTGSATASVGGDWLAQSALKVTLPNGATFSGIALATASGTTISLFRSGTQLPAGTYAIGRVGSSPTFPAGGYSGGYVVRRPDGLQIFLADSGAVSIAETGRRVSGTFTLYAKHYDVIPVPTAEMSGKPITVLESGESPVTISGTFEAVTR